MKRILSLCMVCILTSTLLFGCTKSNSNDNVVNISILNSKPELEEQLNNLIEQFSKDNSDINIKVVKYSQAGTYQDKLSSLHLQDNAPTMAILDPSDIRQYADNSVDLSAEEWVNDIAGNISSIAKNKDGKLIAFPFTTEGIGFIYNKDVLQKAGVNAENIKTISQLEEAFQKIEAIGKKGVVVTNEEWSLGDHFASTFYSFDQNASGKNSDEYFKDLKNKELKSNEKLNSLIDTFDIMKKYNMYSSNPLLPSYEKCAEVLGSGEVGFWYMGNWASQQILSYSSGNNELGFIPVPMSNNSSDDSNNKITLGVTKYIVLDSKNNSQQQQEAAKKFLNYLVYNSAGNKFFVEDAGIIPAFKNIEVNSTDPLVKSIISYRDNNKVSELMNSYLPSDNSKVIGGSLKKYLNNEISRDELLSIIDEFWS
ncbi:MAG: ABC transporter substrate-binding protein [Clostridiaceae bacterium]|nr:ABC transporter substrate-binding protein [Clostridiaceae bacterium]